MSFRSLTVSPEKTTNYLLEIQYVTFMFAKTVSVLFSLSFFFLILCCYPCSIITIFIDNKAVFDLSLAVRTNDIMKSMINGKTVSQHQIQFFGFT